MFDLSSALTSLSKKDTIQAHCWRPRQLPRVGPTEFVIQCVRGAHTVLIPFDGADLPTRNRTVDGQRLFSEPASPKSATGLCAAIRAEG